MHIDWFTLVAQILNFAILIWILNRFLYQPVLGIVAERQEAIRKSITDANEEKALAAKERKQLEEERLELSRKRESEIQLAHEDARAEKDRLMGDAREEFDTARTRWKQALVREQDDFNNELAGQVQREVLAISGKLLTELADADLEALMLGKFLKAVAGINQEQRTQMRSSFQNGYPATATVRSAFELKPMTMEKVKNAASLVLGSDTQIKFETRPSLGCGIEISTEGHKIGWTTEDYLRSLKASISKLPTHPPHENAS